MKPVVVFISSIQCFFVKPVVIGVCLKSTLAVRLVPVQCGSYGGIFLYGCAHYLMRLCPMQKPGNALACH